MKKILSGVLVLLFAFIIKMPDVMACSIGVSAPSSTVVGKSFKVSVNVSSGSSLGSWEYTLSYDSSKVRLNSGQLHVVDYGNGSKKSASYSYTFTSLTSGVATFKAVNAQVIDYTSENECLSGAGSASVTMKTQAEIESGYSKNNNLSNLSIEGAELSPKFNANTLSYTATLPADTTKAKVIATKADSSANVSGAGEVDVVDGVNKISVVVTAQHGEQKTYVIELTVKELNPIEVTVNNKKYTVIRKDGIIKDIPNGFVLGTIKLKDQDIAMYENKSLGIMLVGLKDKKGEASLFIYDQKAKEFKSFDSAMSANLNLLILSKAEGKVPYLFDKTSFKYNDIKINGYKYKFDKKDNFYLIYAMNLEDGKKGFYLYDKDQNTFQRYYKKFDSKTEKTILIVVAAIVLFIALVILSWIFKILKKIFTSKDKKIKKLNKRLNKLNNTSDKDDDEEDKTVEVTKIDDDDYVMPKKNRKQKRKELMDAKKLLDKDKTSIRRISLEPDEMDDYGDDY